MAIKITVGSKEPKEKESKPIAEVELQIRSTLDGDLLITDHADMDIIIMKEKIKCQNLYTALRTAYLTT